MMKAEEVKFVRNRVRKPSVKYNSNTNCSTILSYARKNTACLKCINEHILGVCPHSSSSNFEMNIRMENMNKRKEDISLASKNPGFPKRKQRGRKRVWYPHDFYKSVSSRDNFIEQAERLNNRDCYVISEESKSNYPSENFTGGSSPNVKSQDGQEVVGANTPEQASFSGNVMNGKLVPYEFKVNKNTALGSR